MVNNGTCGLVSHSIDVPLSTHIYDAAACWGCASHSEEDSDNDDEERDDLHGSSRDRVDSWTDFHWGILLTFYAPPVLAMITFSEQYTASWQPENDVSIEIWLHSNVIVVFLSDRTHP